jgi:aspartate aminotransferase, cytoplasmic
MTSTTLFDAKAVPQAPEDPLFGLMAAYRADSSDKKVDLGIGAYRDNNAKPWILPVVKKVSPLSPPPVIAAHRPQADKIYTQQLESGQINNEYLPIAGLAEFTAGAQKLILGPDSPAIKDGRVRSLLLSLLSLLPL